LDFFRTLRLLKLLTQIRKQKPELWNHSAKIRAFAKRNRKIRYVPEEFLEQLGLEAEGED